jgi:hypothetical protein
MQNGQLVGISSQTQISLTEVIGKSQSASCAAPTNAGIWIIVTLFSANVESSICVNFDSYSNATNRSDAYAQEQALHCISSDIKTWTVVTSLLRNVWLSIRGDLESDSNGTHIITQQLEKQSLTGTSTDSTLWNSIKPRSENAVFNSLSSRVWFNCNTRKAGRTDLRVNHYRTWLTQITDHRSACKSFRVQFTSLRSAWDASCSEARIQGKHFASIPIPQFVALVSQSQTYELKLSCSRKNRHRSIN